MTDADLLTLCAYREASIEPDDGLAAVVRVVLNRMARKYQSDGTMAGTVFGGNGCAFSWAAFDFVNGRYQRVASGLDQIEARAEHLLTICERYPAAWGRAQRITGAVQDGSYRGGFSYGKLTPETVLYLNPQLSHTDWATPENFVVQIGRHAFYRDAA